MSFLISDDATSAELAEAVEEQRAVRAAEKLRKLIHVRTAQRESRDEWGTPELWETVIYLSFRPEKASP